MITSNLKNILWKSFQSDLEQKYSVLKYIDLLELDYQVEEIQEMLESVYKNEYKLDEKIVILHYDTDFYLYNSIGVTLHNLITIINYLNISPSVFIILTNHYGLNSELEQYYKKNYRSFNIDNDWFNIIENNYTSQQAPEDNFLDCKVDSNQIMYHYSCLNGSPRTHRKVLLAAMSELNIINKGITSWMFANSDQNISSEINHVGYKDKKTNINLLKIEPFTRINDHWPLSDYLDKCLTNHITQFDYNYQHKEVTGKPNHNRWDLQFCRKAFLQVVTETVLDYPHVYFTEKTIRNFLLKRPFVIVGAPGTLKILHSLGFKTFNDFWNEDYDNTLDPSQRIHKILKIIEDICSKDITELQSMCYNMREILDYNFKNYTTNYATIRAKSLINEL